MPHVTSPSGGTVLTARSPARKYVAAPRAAPMPNSRPSASSRRPCHTSATIARPSSASAVPTHIRAGRITRRTNRTHRATRIGAVNSSSIATPIGIRDTAAKYSNCTAATPTSP
jgi:hypothetical protein